MDERTVGEVAAVLRSASSVVVLTSAVVQPSAGFIHLARGRGAKTVEVNRDPTPITRMVDWALSGKSGEVLPVLTQMGSGLYLLL